MGIQYVTVQVDTSGLYQPLSSSVGVVGIIGPAPSAGAGFSNPTLFTRPLVGAATEPYARVVSVMRAAQLASAAQSLSIINGTPTTGTFTVSFGGQTTAALAFNATAAQVQVALQALSSIGANNVTCSGGPLPASSVLMIFAGTLAFRAQSLISVAANTLDGGATPAIAQATAGALVSDVQTLSLANNPTAGTFTLTYLGQTTAALPFNATGAQIQAALSGLSNIGSGNVSCSSGPLPAANVTITFTGALSSGAQPVLAAGPSSLTGGTSPAASIASTTTGVSVAAVQTLDLTGTPTGGTFELTFGGQTTAAIPFNATSAQVEAALVALSSIGAGNLTCSGAALPAGPISMTFAGTLAPGPQPLMTVGNDSLTGGTAPAPQIASQTAGQATAAVQTLAISNNPNAGSFTLTFGGLTTAPIPFNATSAQVQAALTALAAIGAGNLTCSGGTLPGANVTMTFAGQLAPGPQPTITANSANLVGAGSPQVSVAHTTVGKGVANFVLPVDPDNNIIPNVGWNPARGELIDTVSGGPLSVNTATRTLQYTSGQAFQNGTENATIVLDGYSITSATVSAPSPVWGVPLDTDGQPIPNLLMRPDAAPASAFVDFSGNVLRIDGTLGSSAGGTGKPVATNGSIYYTVTFGLCMLATSINLALNNGALQAWGYNLPPGQPFDGTAAFADFTNRQINIVCLSSDSNPDDITALRTHVETASPNDAGGGGIRPRIGVAMLPMGGISDANGNLTNRFSDWKTEEEQQNGLPSPMNWSSNRMTFVAANSPDDIACAAAGVIAGVDPWVSLILKPVTGIGINGDLSDQAIQTYIAPAQSGINQPHVIPIVHPDFLAGSGPVMGEGFTADGTGQRLYVDIVRTIDDIAFQLKATLTSPQVIGTLRINRPGLRVLASIVRAALRARVALGEIDDFDVDIPIQALTELDPSQLTPEQQQQLQQVQNSRQLAFNISITYSGAIHQMVVTLRFI